jgi:cation:H+ antiporter
MALTVLLVLVAFAVLTAGAEALVRGASALGLRSGISPLVVGLTIVAFGTSAPELAVSVKAALQGSGDIAVGNIVGSNIFNVAAILGVSALVRPLTVHLQVIRFDTPLMLVVSLAFAAMLIFGDGLSRVEAALLFAGIIAYTVHSVCAARRESAAARAQAPGLDPPDALAVPKRPLALWACLALVVGGLATLVIGARLLVDNAIVLARAIQVSEAVIGLTIVAAGTSLPELATSLVASLRRETDIAIGNIVGSNIFNVLCIGGATGLVASPVTMDGIRHADLYWMLGVSCLLLPLQRSGLTLQRWEGALLLASYGAYLALLWPK